MGHEQSQQTDRSERSGQLELTEDDLARVVGGSGDPIEGGPEKTGAH